MPKKIREPKAVLSQVGFTCAPKRAKADIQFGKHPLLPYITLLCLATDGDDAKRYQEKDGGMFCLSCSFSKIRDANTWWSNASILISVEDEDRAYIASLSEFGLNFTLMVQHTADFSFMKHSSSRLRTSFVDACFDSNLMQSQSAHRSSWL